MDDKELAERALVEFDLIKARAIADGLTSDDLYAYIAMMFLVCTMNFLACKTEDRDALREAVRDSARQNIFSILATCELNGLSLGIPYEVQKLEKKSSIIVSLNSVRRMN